jgi:hypothetical protein
MLKRAFAKENSCGEHFEKDATFPISVFVEQVFYILQLQATVMLYQIIFYLMIFNVPEVQTLCLCKFGFSFSGWFIDSCSHFNTLV